MENKTGAKGQTKKEPDKKQSEKKVTITMPKKPKVCILGFAESKALAPFDDKEFEFWGVNEMHMDEAIKKLDVIFELHDYKWICEGKRIKTHIDWLRENKETPIFMQKHFDDIPMSVAFPKKKIMDRFGSYFTNTISWEIALAIELGFREIHLYGVHMANELEYSSQRPSCEYFLGIIEGMRQAGKDIKFYVPSESDLLKSMYLYGFEDGELSVISAKLDSFMGEQDKRIGGAQQQLNGAQIALHQSIGAKSAADYIKKSFVFPNTNFSEVYKE